MQVSLKSILEMYVHSYLFSSGKVRLSHWTFNILLHYFKICLYFIGCVYLCFCSSMVIRDLTLRSAASFGSFHLIRLLYDEYMFYLVEHKVARATGETPIAVMGEVRQVRNK